MFKGRCAVCNAEGRSKAFKSRPEGTTIPPITERALEFFFESVVNNKICKSCYDKNYKLLKKRKEARQRKREEEVVDNVQSEGNKKRHMDEEQEEDFCVEISLVESQDEEQQQMNEKEGIAIQVLTNLKVKLQV